MEITSPAFDHNGYIPQKYTCQGADPSPPLSFSGIPEGTKSLALICDDPDAPDPKAPKMVYVHWVLYNMDPTTTGLEEGIGTPGPKLSNGAMQGENDWKKLEWGGPCPPIGTHRYFFKLYALDTMVKGKKLTKKELLAAMEGHIIEQAEIVGKYEKS